MAEMPVDPRLAKVLITSKHFECTEDVLSVAAILTVQGPWLQQRPTPQNKEALRESMREFAAPEGDHATYAHLYKVNTLSICLCPPESFQISTPCPGMAKPT